MKGYAIGKVKIGILCLGIIFVPIAGTLKFAQPQETESKDEIIQAIQSFRNERDHFFKNAPNSPLEDSDKLLFKSIHYISIDLRYRPTIPLVPIMKNMPIGLTQVKSK